MKRASNTAEHDRHGTALSPSSSSSSSPKRMRTPRSVSSSASSGVSSGKGPRKTGVMTTCKTCIACRQKKVKCDSKRPECGACSAKGIDCAYPNDTRRLLRPSQQTVGHIEQRLATIWDNINAARQSKIPLPDESTLLDASLHAQSWLPSPESQESSARAGAGARAGGTEPTDRRVRQRASDSDENLSQSSLSPHEAHIAGVDVGHDGLISVHGASSMMHPRPPPATLQHTFSGSSSRPLTSRKSSRAALQARLVSHAAIQRQRESFVYSNPPPTMDLDGVDPELARHLIDLHWNRQHYAYLLTYRPAVMDSLVNGGRWCNKLLLNAMYYTSSLYSDRECLRSTPQDTQSAGDRFYRRFRELLIDEIVRPSIPTAAALLLTGTALVSQGRASAGWTLCGTAYRMVIDMGCHLTVDSAAGDDDINTDVELEWRRRLYWVSFLTDATQSLYLGRQMTMRPAEARVPQMFLDTYEEMEEWMPYIDPSQPVESQSTLLGFRARPAYAVSVFGALIRLSQKTERITQAFYSINCVKRSQGDVAEVKADIERDLSSWLSTLPEHLRFDPLQSPLAVPPPHQITPHTTYHTLNILLQRPFIDGGYLQDRVTREERGINEQKCVESALAIWKLVDAYRTGLTLRRAPFLLSYAVYSAVVVILRQSKKEQQQQHQRSQRANSTTSSKTGAEVAGGSKAAAADRFREPINFFWTALSELQRGCNFGLRKPVAIIRDMMDELGDIAPQLEHPPADAGGLTLFERMLEMCGSSSNDQQQHQQPQGMSAGGGGGSRDTGQEGLMYPQQVGGSDMSGMGTGCEYHQCIGVSGGLDNNNNNSSSADDGGGISATFEPTPPGFLDFLDDTEQTITNDTLYGLFAEQPSWF